MRVATVGFTGDCAALFDLLKGELVRTVLDIRLNNTSQLAGCAKKWDLPYLLERLCDATYVQLPELRPELDMLNGMQAKQLEWDDLVARYLKLIAKRRVESNLDVGLFHSACLLCSEHLPHRCHRRLAVEYLNARWNERMTITPLT